MRKTRFSEEQIINILKGVEAGQRVADACRTHASLSRPTTAGKRSTAASTSTRPAASSRSKTRTAGSRRRSRI